MVRKNCPEVRKKTAVSVQLFKMSQLSWCYIVSMVFIMKSTKAYYFNSVPHPGDEPRDYQLDPQYNIGNVLQGVNKDLEPFVFVIKLRAQKIE
jgi:hypothetical protein